MTQNPTEAAILVTGANGRLGQLLHRAWSQVLRPERRMIYLARSAPADLIWTPDKPLDALPACSTVIALWGVTSGTAEELAQNTALARQSLELARACGAKRVLHFSSAAVYGPGSNMHESKEPAPVTAYGHAKLAMEAEIAGFPAEGIHHCCLRLANVVGADSLAPALRPSPRPLSLDRFGNGDGPMRSYIAPGDLARVLIAMAQLPPHALPDTLNVTSPKPIAMAALADAAGRNIDWQDAPETAIQTVTLDGTRLERLLPGIIDFTTARWMVANWQQLEAAK
ncbi:NAD-dependent epimerase/dehydratase family protein [Roseovarius litorisediminis]|nr:NAD-dependent epimerase/dehydratase family protein [Roseovarius litorisediminis]